MLKRKRRLDKKKKSVTSEAQSTYETGDADADAVFKVLKMHGTIK